MFAECDLAMEKYSCILNNIIQENVSIKIFNSVRINGYTYKPKLLIEINFMFFEIENIFFYNNSYWVGSSVSYHIKEFNNFLHSVELEKNRDSNSQIFNILDLKNGLTYEIVLIDHKSFIAAETLELPFSA